MNRLSLRRSRIQRRVTVNRVTEQVIADEPTAGKARGYLLRPLPDEVSDIDTYFYGDPPDEPAQPHLRPTLLEEEPEPLLVREAQGVFTFQLCKEEELCDKVNRRVTLDLDTNMVENSVNHSVHHNNE